MTYEFKPFINVNQEGIFKCTKKISLNQTSEYKVQQKYLGLHFGYSLYNFYRKEF